MKPPLALRFLGVGNAQAVELGSASAVIECAGAPLLMIDCGQQALCAYLAHYQGWPDALFVTHAHFDHIGGLERLLYQTLFDRERCGRVRLYCAAALVPILQARVADYPGVLAEGGANFWDAFQLIPVSRGFWHAGFWFEVFPVRHHLPDTAFGLALPGALLWSGDTRPIPERLARHAAQGERIAHDCGLRGNPSHSGLDDLLREYQPEQLRRLIAYHYASTDDAAAIAAAGLTVARAGELFELPEPLDPQLAAARCWSDGSHAH
ncbi:MAG: MBL fold metallo-hydrolase [Lysobacterales bacterium]